MFFSFCILFYCVLNSNLLAGEVLAIHLGNGQIGAAKVIIADEAMAFAFA